MFGRNFFYVMVGMGIAIPLTSIVHALTLSEIDTIETQQKSALKFTGTYQPVYDSLVQIYTYEKLCRGFYTVEDNGIIVRYTGFGDLADLYTYETVSPKYVEKYEATTTKDTIPVGDIVPTEPIL